ncbi:MAG: hypothetical protein RL681_62 [Candidatus Parcubacteria bacterium]|jgi:hypothetical protein
MKQASAISLILLFGSVSLFGILSMLGHDGEHGGMMHCPLMGDVSSMCPFGGVSHIAAWESAFAAMTPQTVFILLLIIACVGTIVSVLIFHGNAPPFGVFSSSIFQRTGHAPDHLLLALSRGVLHPRLYA